MFAFLSIPLGSVARLRDRIDDRNAFRFSYHLLEAVEWIHSKGIIHADIKPDNCLINRSNNLVLSDFGSAVILPKVTKLYRIIGLWCGNNYLLCIQDVETLVLPGEFAFVRSRFDFFTNSS